MIYDYTHPLAREAFDYIVDGKVIEQDNFGSIIATLQDTEPGTTTRKEFYIQNKLPDNMSLQVRSNDESLKFVEFPSMIRAGSKEKVIIEFAPDKNRLTPLKSSWEISVAIG